MSFIYAKKVNDSIALFADTKISFDLRHHNALFSEITKRNVQRFGLIKNVIVSKNLCVSFAGNIIGFNELLSKINKVTLQKLLEIAVEIHQKSMDDGVDFIICYADTMGQKIYQIKNNKCECVEVAWIGSYDAFCYFQGELIGAHNKKNISDPFEAEVSSIMINEECDRLFRAFWDTIEYSGDNSVGGFVIPICFDMDSCSFNYHGYIKSFEIMEIDSGYPKLPPWQGSERGAYSIAFFYSDSRVAFYLPQGNLGVIYNYHRDNRQEYEDKLTSYLLLPKITCIDELEFCFQLEVEGLSAPGYLSNPNTIYETILRLEASLERPMFVLPYIDKAIEILETEYSEEEYHLTELLRMRENIISKTKLY